MKKNLIALTLAAMIASPAFTLAATYGYINTSGKLATVVANSAAQALALPSDISEHSGVILLSSAPVMVMPVATSTNGTSSMMIASSTATTSMMTAATSTATSTMSASSTATTTTK